VRTYKWSGVTLEGLPHLERWVRQLAERPACQRGLTVPPRPPRDDAARDAERFVAEARRMVETGRPRE
jgi:glutathione S-transferase/GST-like protein